MKPTKPYCPTCQRVAVKRIFREETERNEMIAQLHKAYHLLVRANKSSMVKGISMWLNKFEDSWDYVKYDMEEAWVPDCTCNAGLIVPEISDTIKTYNPSDSALSALARLRTNLPNAIESISRDLQDVLKG
jgi:hypothetical protein